jgi:hypothetical protein
MNQAATAQEAAFWKTVSEDLKIDIVTPFEVIFSDGARLRVAALVRNFGRPQGMLVVFDYDQLKPYVQKIIENGYGYVAQLGSSPGEYNRAAMVDILSDWGWSGAEDRRPLWLASGED